MATEYKSTPLFGGAIIADIPKEFADVSTFRQVPSHQEVFLSAHGFTSLIIDITERVGPSGSSDSIDGAALIIHLEEITETTTSSDTLKVWSITRPPFSHLSPDIPCYSLVATQTPKPGDGDKNGEGKDFTAVVMSLVRLEKENTDILVTVNVPHIKGEYEEGEVDLEGGKQGRLIEEAVEHMARVWESFKIKDWGLFDA